MKQIKVEAFVCIDEHGNYRVLGTSESGKERDMIAIVESGIKLEGVNAKTVSFKVMVQLPEPSNKEGESNENK